MNRSRHILALTGTALALLTLAAYAPAVRGEFIWDDDDYVVNNPHLRSLAGLGQIWFNPKSTPQYYPLVHTSFWMEYQLWGLEPAGYHAVNILLHAAAAVLLLVLLRRLQIPGALLAAAIFAVHPVHVESVAWITERKNVLSLVFYLLSLMAYLGFLEAETGARRRRHYVLSLLLFAAALLSKTVACSLPAALLLIIYWRRGRIGWADVRPLLPMIVLGAVLGLHTAWLEKSHVGAEGGDWSLPLAHRFLVAGRIICFYAFKLVWPANLMFVYPRWQVDPIRWPQFIYPFLVVLILAGLFAARARLGRGPLVAVLFFILTLFPALGFVDVYPMRFSFVADHFQYHASIGLIVLVSAASAWALQSARRHRTEARAEKPWVLPTERLAAVAVILTLAALTWRQAAMYRDLETLWRTTLTRNPTAWLAHGNLGNLLRMQGRVAEAAEHYNQVLRYNPNDAGAMNNLGNLLLEQNLIDEAIPLYRRALVIDPRQQVTKYHLAKCLARKGLLAEAADLVESRLQSEPDHPESHNLLGQVRAGQGRPTEALVHYLEALEQRPDWPEAANNAAWILATSPDDSVRDGRRAVVLAEQACRDVERAGGADPMTLDTLAAAYAETGRLDEAVRTARRALDLARQQNSENLAGIIGDHLRLFENGKPLRAAE